jgi:hypothetical protein
MRFLYAKNAQAVDNDPEVELAFTANASDPDAPAFKADWIEVVNAGANEVYATPYGTMGGGTPCVGVCIPAGKTYRFEWSDRLHGLGFTSLFLVGTAGGTTVYVSAGAE